MIEFLISVFSGIFTATGLGGGTILILLFSFFLGIGQHQAQAINLIFYIPTAIISILINIKQKLIDIKLSIIIIIAGIIGSVIGATVASKLDVIILKKIFGFFLLAIAAYEIYGLYISYIRNKKEHNKYG